MVRRRDSWRLSLPSAYPQPQPSGIPCDPFSLRPYKLTDAADLARTAQADVALLDLNLGGTLAYPVADVLRQRGVPIVFTTGYGSAGLIERFQDCPILDKPFDQHSLEKAIHAILSSNACSSDRAA